MNSPTLWNAISKLWGENE